MKLIKTYTEIMSSSSGVINRLRKKEITSMEAEQIMEENAFYLEHWRIVTARTTINEMRYLNN